MSYYLSIFFSFDEKNYLALKQRIPWSRHGVSAVGFAKSVRNPSFSGGAEAQNV
jgi:hypothetical protein